MLSLYSRAYFCNDKPSLVALSTDVRTLYLDRSRTERSAICHSYGKSLLVTSLELFNSLNALVKKGYQPMTYIKALTFSISLPAIVTVLEAGSPMQPRAIAACLLSIVPWERLVSRLLWELEIPSRFEYGALAMGGALTQVLAIQKSHGQPLNPVNITFKTVVLAGFLHLNAQFVTKYLSRNWPRIPDWIWLSILSVMFDSIIQRFVRFGLVSTATWMAERMIQGFMNLWVRQLPDLPETVPIPEALECPICHELLKQPVVLLGHFFCQSCLRPWMESNDRHPYTGEPVSPEMVESSILMNQVVSKWHRLAWQELNEQGAEAPQPNGPQ
jgi:hypothetical protein